jgi:hypothetical protein
MFIEFVLFTLPIYPENLYIRLAIALSYYIGHVLKVQVYYARLKYYVLNNKNREDDTTNYESFILSNENIEHIE